MLLNEYTIYLVKFNDQCFKVPFSPELKDYFFNYEETKIE